MTWTHIPRLPVLIWCLWIFPFTVWDTLYLLLRPHSLPGGKWNEPYFGSTFNTWASVDQIYGAKGWREKDGWVLAQSAMNTLEAGLCVIYVWMVSSYGIGSFWAKTMGRRAGGRACLVGFAAGIVTWVKTAMYCKLNNFGSKLQLMGLVLREPLGAFRYTGHNEWGTFLVVWVGMK